MKIDFKTCSEEELWKFVGSHLSMNGIDAVLVGGAVVSIYSDGLYESGDLDFIVQNLKKDRLPSIMGGIGFKKKGRHYVHPECKHLFVEFPSGPLGIGNDVNIKPVEKIDGENHIKILSPTDCIKDRLASYIHFKSKEGLDQAILVARKQPFKKSEVQRWCKAENSNWAFDDFVKKLKV
jgi:hypothetical protein